MSLAEFLAEETIATRDAWKLPIDHLSASSLAMFSRCPEQWRHRYLLGERETPGGAMLIGGADHATWEHNFQQKIDTHQDLPVSDLEIVFAEAFDRRVDEAGGPDEVVWDTGGDGAAKDKGVQLVRAYASTAATVQPVSVERKFEVAAAGLPVPIVGRIDVEQAASVLEMKTSAKKLSEPKPDWRLQGLLYQHESRKPVHWHVKVKTKVPAVYTPETDAGLVLEPDARMVMVTLERASRMARQMAWLFDRYGPDEAWDTSAPEHPWACGYCGWAKTCVWRGNV